VTRTSAEVVVDARSTREAEEALALRRDELGEAGYVQAMRRLVGPERYVDWIEGMYLGRYGRGSSRCGGAEKGQQMAAAKKQEGIGTLRFSGKLLKVAAKAPSIKETGWGERRTEVLAGGGLTLQIYVERPQLPEAPEKPYALTHGGRPADPGPEPVYEAPTAAEGEKPAEFKKRTKEAEKAYASTHGQWERARERVAGYEAEEAKWAEAQRRHQAKVASIQDELTSYGTLVLAGGLMSGLEFAATLRPSAAQVRKFLPGFVPEAALLTLGAGDGATDSDAEVEEAAG